MAAETSIVPILAALTGTSIAGFFGLISLIGSKESKVSEFRQAWIDGLRSDISVFAAATHELAMIEPLQNSPDVTNLEYARLSSGAYTSAREALTNIQLRLNHKHANQEHKLEGKVWRAVLRARDLFNERKYNEVIEALDSVRDHSSVLLKNEWGRVKRGEFVFLLLKVAALLATGVAVFGIYSIYSGWDWKASLVG